MFLSKLNKKLITFYFEKKNSVYPFRRDKKTTEAKGNLVRMSDESNFTSDEEWETGLDCES